MFKNIWSHLNTFENLWKHLDTFENIWNIWKHLNTFGYIWKHLDTFENIWKHLDTFENIWKPLLSPAVLGIGGQCRIMWTLNFVGDTQMQTGTYCLRWPSPAAQNRGFKVEKMVNIEPWKGQVHLNLEEVKRGGGAPGASICSEN